MKIGIDIDEIITEYMKSFLDFLNVEKKIVIDYNQILDYNNIGNVGGIKNEQIQKYIQEHTSQDLTVLELGLIEGSLEAINFLDGNYEICFITSRHVSNKEKTKQFFKKYFPDKNFKIIFSGDHWGGNKNKSEICIEGGCNVLIEDNLKYAEDCVFKGIKVILFDKPWNKSEKEIKNIFRVTCWKEAFGKIKEIENGNL